MRIIITLVITFIFFTPLTLWSQNTAPEESEIFLHALNNAEKANEAFIRNLRNTDAWLNVADPVTLLIPDRMDETLYTPHNSAADNYPFMILNSYYTDQKFYLTTAKEMLFNELHFATMPDGMPCNYDIKTKEQSGGTIFSASEYVKDGLIPITELMGHSIWSERMLKLVDLIIENSNVKSDYV